jgi:tRNA A37 N6-isopentenylltransferase MiaA
LSERLIALFGPTGVGKTEVALALAERLREQGERPVAVSADALQVYAGLELLTGVATAAEQARLEHRLVSFLPVDARSASPNTPPSRMLRSTSCSRTARRRSCSAAPACTCGPR